MSSFIRHLGTSNVAAAIFLTAWHMFFATIVTRFLASTTTLFDGRKRFPMTWNQYARSVAPVGLVFSLSLNCASTAYPYLDIPTIQMLEVCGGSNA